MNLRLTRYGIDLRNKAKQDKNLRFNYRDLVYNIYIYGGNIPMTDLNKYISNPKRPLPVFLLLDTSGSMQDYDKILNLNIAVKQMIADFKSSKFMNLSLQLTIITFGGTAKVNVELQDVNQVEYSDLTAKGGTPLGAALALTSQIILDKNKVTSKGYTPVILLVSDGKPDEGWEPELDKFIKQENQETIRLQKCERWAIGIGKDFVIDMLEKFIKNPFNKVFTAEIASSIASFFKIVTLSTTNRAKSQDPDKSLKIDELKESIKKNMPDFDPDFDFDK